MKLIPFLTRLVSLCFVLGTAVVHADQLRLSNGDLITGKLVSHENGLIRFNSPVLGTLELKDSAASIVTEVPKEKQKGKDQASPPSTGGNVGQGKSGEPGSKWRSKVDVGMNWQNGSKEKRDISLRFESQRQSGSSQYRVQSRYLLSETNGTKSADSRTAGLRWRRDFNERWFSQTHTIYSDDEVRKIDLNLDQNVGLGYRVLAGDHAKANLGAGVTLQYRQAAGRDEGVAKFGELFQDLVWRFHERFEFAQEASAQFSPDERPVGVMSQVPGATVPEDVANYRLVFESVIRGKLTETMSVNLRFEYAFDNAVVNRDARSDQRITTSLGYMF